MTQPLVSIVTGYYNRLHGLEESIGSVLAQTYPNFEYIVFDDCSTDGTRERLEAIKDPRLRLIKHEHNIGFTRGIINAVKQANGEFIAVHGAGDISYPTRIEKQVEHMMANPGCVAVGVRVVQENLKTSKVIEFLNPPTISSGGNPYTHGEVMFRRAAYVTVGGYREVFSFAQDRDLWLRMSRTGTLDQISETLYRRILFEDGVNENPQKRHLQRICSNLASYAHQQSNGDRDLVDRRHAMALLLQKRTPAFAKYSDAELHPKFVAGQYEPLRELLDATPLCLLSNRDLLICLLVRSLSHRRGLLNLIRSLLYSPRFHARAFRAVVRFLIGNRDA
jgi:glycosyltransferase involved in cell wall biosynthesis